jgi:lipid-A-disaccharide synthase
LDVLIVAAEASSSLYAKRLLEEWSRRGRKVHAFGIGSQDMTSLGFEALGRAEDLAVVGIQEVLSNYTQIRRVFWSLVKKAEEQKPKFALLFDYPDFNLRLAKELKKRGFKVIYYISPQVWAWRKSRIHQIKKNVDRMLVLFPFEKEFYEKNGVEVDFVGHPLLDELTEDRVSPRVRHEGRQRLGLLDHEVLLGIMPGSRKSELKHHFQLFIDVADRLNTEMPGLKLALLVAPTVHLDHVRNLLPKRDFPLRIVQDDPIRMISYCDVVLCKSGTGSLLVGVLGKPMVIVYKMNAFSAWLARRFVEIKNFGMINLVLKRTVVPELFQEQASVENIVNELRPLILDANLREKKSLEIKEILNALGDKGATKRVADVLEGYF